MLKCWRGRQAIVLRSARTELLLPDSSNVEDDARGANSVSKEPGRMRLRPRPDKRRRHRQRLIQQQHQNHHLPRQKKCQPKRHHRHRRTAQWTLPDRAHRRRADRKSNRRRCKSSHRQSRARSEASATGRRLQRFIQFKRPDPEQASKEKNNGKIQ
jgi:hypothetical protein